MLDRRWLATAALFALAGVGPLEAGASVNCSGADTGGARTCTADIQAAQAGAAIHDRQAESRWCWAAAISNVFHYYGYTVGQARIVRETYGRVANVAGSEAGMALQLNRTWTDDQGRRFQVRTDDVRAPGAAIELAQGKPVILTTHNHAVILTRLTYVRRADGGGAVTLAVVRDPWPQNPNERVLTRSEWDDVRHFFRISVGPAAP